MNFNSIEKRIKLSSDNLKIIAIISMIIDHLAFGLLHLYLQKNSFSLEPNTFTRLNTVYDVLRDIGRTAFPIFAFFLVEGFFHTRNVKKYALRLALFALISEVPFDLAFYQTTYYPEHQNVMLSLLIGLITLMLFDYIKKLPEYSTVLRVVLYICVSAAAMDLAQLLYCDYKWKGILLIIVLYFFHEAKHFKLIAGAAVVSWKKFAPISFLFLYFYDETKKPSRKMKYIFYAFYPAHLLLIYFIALALGLL